MGEGTLLKALTVAQVLHLAVAIFFHEQSRVPILPYPPPEGFSDFGFALGYRSGPQSLVVGAPRASDLGQFYSCPVSRGFSESRIDCDANLFEFEELAEYSRDVNPSQYFYTGSSIAATSNYIFTCAPLWTSNVQRRHKKAVMSDAFGTCFMMNNTNTYRYKGTLERYLGHQRIKNLNTLTGGTGWSTLVDEENDLLLIVKTSLIGDFVYTHMSTPLAVTKSLVLQPDYASQEMAKFLEEHWNIGFGITAGKFFSPDKTVYAFSMEMKAMEGAISFLEYNSTRNMLSIMYESKSLYKLTTTAIGTMFGSAMAAADLNMDGKHELLVGAPAQSEEDCVECGALHIYLGGDMKTLDHKDRLRTILGTVEFGRFGTAITASDIDGDGISEIVVSAPYIDEGRGAIYILSGYELYRDVIRFQIFKRIQVSDLKLTQKIQLEPKRLLGFSLQLIPDVDSNGCSELVAGSPGNASAVLFKCIPQINVTMSNELIGKQPVREQADNFAVEVCAQVQLHKLPNNIVGNLAVACSIVGDGTSIPEPKFNFDISCYNCTTDRQFCKNVTVLLSDNDPHHYTFTSEAVLYNEHIFSSEDFNNTWVISSPYSKLVDTIGITRKCRGEDCMPDLSIMGFEWSGNSSNKYVLGSSLKESLTITMRNDGSESYDACVLLRVTGGLPTSVDCHTDNDVIDIYKCDLPKPLGRHADYSIGLLLDMSKPNNLHQELKVEVRLRENCNQKNSTEDATFTVEYVMPADDIFINGISHNRNITDTQVYNNETIFDVQEYLITNNGKITWENVVAYIEAENKPFILSTKVSAMDLSECESNTQNNSITCNCLLTLKANSTQKIIVTTEILAVGIKPDILHNERLNMTSELILHLYPTRDIKKSSVTTVMQFEEERTFANNKLLIALIALLVALIILAILIFILYKMGFFRRKQKQRLHVLRESIKQQNSRRTTHASSRDGPSENFEGLQMDVDEDPFDEIAIPVTTKDDVVLVEEKGQDHSKL